jgi:SAM-dependent methyltransferase
MTITTAPAASAPSPSALALFDDALRRAATGLGTPLTIHGGDGDEHRVDAAAWCRGHLAGDRKLLATCAGPTLDVGCGPGRLTGALARLGHPALGIDVSPTAVRLTRARGGAALRRDVFGALPGEGRWRHLLLADGNIGIGGDPERLLRRCRDLLGPDGRLHVELGRPGTATWSGEARLSAGGATSEPFGWAAVAADNLAALAAASALRIRTTWTEADRWFATLTRA